jgi:hypothetical protein
MGFLLFSIYCFCVFPPSLAVLSRASSHAPPLLHHCRTAPSSRSSTRHRLFHSIAWPSPSSITPFFQARCVRFRRPHPSTRHLDHHLSQPLSCPLMVSFHPPAAYLPPLGNMFAKTRFAQRNYKDLKYSQANTNFKKNM